MASAAAGMDAGRRSQPLPRIVAILISPVTSIVLSAVMLVIPCAVMLTSRALDRIMLVLIAACFLNATASLAQIVVERRAEKRPRRG